MECELEGEWELPPALENEALRERAEESSCESDCDCESDLAWSDSDEAAWRKKSLRPAELD